MLRLGFAEVLDDTVAIASYGCVRCAPLQKTEQQPRLTYPQHGGE